MRSRLVAIDEPTDVAEARRAAQEVANDLGFDDQLAGRAAIVVTELATNLLKHVAGGGVFVGLASGGHARGLQVLAIDKGRGIPNVDASLRDGYSTAGTAGSGLGAIRRQSTTFDVFTSPAGTVIGATVFPGQERPLPVGAIVVPVGNETESGDAWSCWSAGELASVFMCDGLGHGREAAAAARVAVDTFRRHAERPAAQVVTAVHEALRSTRGGAIALAELDRRRGTLRYCGLGNISAVVVRPDGDEQHLVSLSGIAGHMMRRLQEFHYQWPAGSTLVMHSDGVNTHWSLGKYSGLQSRRPDVIAGVLFRDHRRGRDDAAIVVAHNGEPG